VRCEQALRRRWLSSKWSLDNLLQIGWPTLRLFDWHAAWNVHQHHQLNVPLQRTAADTRGYPISSCVIVDHSLSTLTKAPSLYMLCSAVRVSSVYSGHLIFFFGGGSPKLTILPPPNGCQIVCCRVFYRPGRLDSELQIYHGNFLLAGNEHRKLFVTKQSKGCKFMSTSENAPKHVLRPGCARIRWGGALRSPRTPRHWRRRLLLREGRGEGLLIRGERKGEREGGGMDKACFPGSAETLVRWGNISVW